MSRATACRRKIVIFENLLAEGVTGTAGSTEQQDKVESEQANRTYVTNQTWERTESDPFLGACIDSAAQKSIIRKQQAQACSDFRILRYTPATSSVKRFSFGSNRHHGLGCIDIRVPVTDCHWKHGT